MSWIDRIREAAYNSPSGVRLAIQYENVSESVEKKTTAFEFPDADGTFVQDTGHTGRRIPLRVFFWGDDYDIDAEAFRAALLERGTGKLEHPTYGVVDVVPFGTITRRDDLKTAANQAVFEVTFWETIGLTYPTAQDDPASDVLSAVDEYKDAVSSEFDIVTSLTSAVEQVGFKNVYLSILGPVGSTLQAIADIQDDVRTEFNAIFDSIESSIDTLISDPVTLAAQTVQLVQSPARAPTEIEVRLVAYDGLISSVITGDDAIALKGNDSSSSNEFHTKDLFTSAATTASILSVINNQFITKVEALEAAESILNTFDLVTDWRDANFQSLEEIDTGASYQKLQEATALTAGFLVQISFSLKQERRIVLDRDRTIIDLSAELYGQVDGQLDFLINSNNLTGSEILEVPKGREIVYYI